MHGVENVTRKASFTISHRSRNRWLAWKKLDTSSNTCMYTESFTGGVDALSSPGFRLDPFMEVSSTKSC